VADHHPRTKRQLRALGMDEDDPKYGRGLCKQCHDQHTAVEAPGGWNEAVRAAGSLKEAFNQINGGMKESRG
jgi:hypothetical protein